MGELFSYYFHKHMARIQSIVEKISKNVHVRYIKHSFVAPGLQTMHPLF